jgi:hypothetical protein
MTTTGQHNATAALAWWQAEASKKHEPPWHEQRDGERLANNFEIFNKYLINI